MITRFTFRGDCNVVYHRSLLSALQRLLTAYVCTLFREYAIQKDIVTDASQRESENTLIGNRFFFIRKKKNECWKKYYCVWLVGMTLSYLMDDRGQLRNIWARVLGIDGWHPHSRVYNNIYLLYASSIYIYMMPYLPIGRYTYLNHTRTHESDQTEKPQHRTNKLEINFYRRAWVYLL